MSRLFAHNSVLRPRGRLFPLIVAAGLVSAWPLGGGGWTSDPALNTVVVDRPGEQVQPKLAPTSDGGMYVSWYDNASGGYDVALQLLDADGIGVWEPNGIIVADRGFSWTMDYGLAVDQADNAVLAFRDDRSGHDEITVAVVSPSGGMLWGETGVQMPRVSEDVYTPSVTVSGDGYVWVAWTDGQDAKVLKLDAKGGPMFDEPVTFTDAEGAQLTASDIQPGEAGSVIVSWVRQLDMYTPRHFYAQKLSAIGEAMWGELDAATGDRAPVTLFDTGSLQMGNFPDFVPDGQGGAVFGFYEVEPWRVHVQWVRADGTMVFEAGGLVAADPAGDEKHVEPALAYNPRTQDIYVFWRLTFDSGPTYRMGLLGQRVTADGGRQWGDGGKALEPVGPTEMTQLETLPVGDGIEVAYVETLGNLDQRIWARRWSAEGESAWASDRVLVSYTQSGISRLTAAWSGSGFTVFGWQDSRGGGGGGDDIYVQNVQPDGTLGPGGGPSFALYLPRLDLRP